MSLKKLKLFWSCFGIHPGKQNHCMENDQIVKLGQIYTNTKWNVEMKHAGHCSWNYPIEICWCVWMLLFFLHRPPPVPVSESQKSSFSASQQSTNQSTEFPNEAQGEFEIQTNPDLPSPARVRWIDAVSRVCAHLSSTVTILFLWAIFMIMNQIIEAFERCNLERTE